MAVLAVACLTQPAAAQARAVPDAVLAQSSAGAVEGQVVALDARRDDATGAIYTYVTLAVDRAWGFAPTSTIVLKQLGGVAGGTALVIGGQARFAIGESVRVFLEVRPRDGTLAVAGLAQGKWTRVFMRANADATARVRWTRDGNDAPASAHDTRALDALTALAGTRVRVTSTALSTSVPATANARSASTIATPSSTGTLPGRWHEADTATPVLIDVDRGGDPRVADRGARALRDAAALWSGAGSLRLAPGVARTPRCFVNDEATSGRITVSYGDPCNEIPDSSPTLAIGGAFFSASDTRLVNGAAYWKLTSGMVVLDAAPGKIDTLTSGCYATLLAHELGHAIGFDHVADRASVMATTLSATCGARLTPSPLGPDDLAAMAAAYPGTGAPTTSLPDAPAGLVASVVGSTVTLEWLGGAADATTELQVGSTAGARDLGTLAMPTAGLVVPNASPGVYFVRLVARNANGQSAPTPDLPVVVTRASADAPLEAAGTSVRLTWQAAPSSLGPVSYLVLAGHAPGAVDYQIPSARPALVVPGVGAGTYYVRVVAVSQAGLMPITPEFLVRVPATP